MNKEHAKEVFKIMIENSWTYKRMTKEEANRWWEVVENHQTQKALKGTYQKRWDTLQAIYTSYLMGIGYDGFTWREEKGKVQF